MSYIIADNIISPAGFGTEANCLAAERSESQLRLYEDAFSLPEPFVASLFTAGQWEKIAADGLTRFESLATASAHAAIEAAAENYPGFDVTSDRVLFVLASTKADVENLTAADIAADTLFPGSAAARIAALCSVTTKPICVCNACISGLSALILADRLLRAGTYDYAVVCGADLQGKFVVSGFQSLKAMSGSRCRPFDIERTGLNLGEAAATVVLSRERPAGNCCSIDAGSIRNDAWHISAPARDGSGLAMAISDVMEGVGFRDIAFINAHGTATMFNDQMEAQAIGAVSLTDVPVNALKGVFGHTMGACGVLETIISARLLRLGRVAPTEGLEEIGVWPELKVSAATRPTTGRTFLKLLSGFGGCNAALRCSLDSDGDQRPAKVQIETTHRVVITPQSVILDGKPVAASSTGQKLLTELYKTYVADYPKFYKMDPLSRLGFIASELLLQAEGNPRGENGNRRGTLLFNRSTSVVTDMKYLETIAGEDEFFPSPSLFVYTLPNIITGEIAIRNGWHGETSFYILPERDENVMEEIVEATASFSQIDTMLTGWIDCPGTEDFIADLTLKNIIRL